MLKNLGLLRNDLTLVKYMPDLNNGGQLRSHSREFGANSPPKL